MIGRILFFLMLSAFAVNAQVVKKENLSKKHTFYWDYHKIKPQSIGSYYTDELGETTLKHGKWEYYDEAGNKVEIRNYYKDKLHGQVKMTFPNGKPRQEGYFRLDIADSVYREWFETGELALEAYYRNGKFWGIKKTWYLDGRQQSEEEYIDSTHYMRSFWLPDSLHTQTLIKGDGEATWYFNTGLVKEWFNYKNGLPHGDFVERSIYGHDLTTGSFIEGKKNGPWRYNYYTGALEKLCTFKMDQLEGRYEYYYDNGQINVEGYFKEGLKDSEWTWYTKQGSRDMQGNFKAGKQHGNWTYWFPTGELSYTAQYTEDKKSGTWNYLYKNGSKFKVGHYDQDEKHGKWETWYENGQLLMSGDYERGKEEGEWQNYWDNGNLKNKSTFKNGQLHGDWVSYYPDNKLKLSGKYKNGQKSGEWIEYFDSGKPKELVTYKVVKHKSKIKYGPMKNHVIYESVKNGHAVSFSQKDFKKTEEGDYKNGEKHGQWTAYYPGGKMPANTMNYKNGQLEGKMKEFDRKGAIITEIEYKEGLKHGKMKIYDKKGKVVKEKEFRNGMQVIEGTANGGGTFSPGR